MPTLCDFDTQSVRHWYEPRPDTHAIINFSRRFVAPPRLQNGIRQLDIGNNANIRVETSMQQITAGIEDIFALAPGDLEFQSGEHKRVRGEPASVRINFERPFVTPPKVVVFLNHIDLDKHFNWRLKTSATDIDGSGFTLNIDTWADALQYGARAGWIAYAEDREHIFSKSVDTMDVRPWNVPQLQQSKKVTFGDVEFWKNPAVFVALNYIDIDCADNLRINARVEDVSQSGLEWHIDSWGDTTLYAAGASIIAFN